MKVDGSALFRPESDPLEKSLLRMREGDRQEVWNRWGVGEGITNEDWQGGTQDYN